MREILIFVFGGALFLLLDWAYRFWANAAARRRKLEADRILMKHGLSSQLYMPAIGVDDKTLWAALDEFTFTGRIITNRNGCVVGKLLPETEKGPHLRLVVDNT